eukprot:TRINITY_DN1216_c0_g2_i8.p1 TRINITY_DN1216_c0_g2~~TRINITY_DN1216_c0_g2_i8.p1  ORF type:complete len:283 (-),score=75.44 TRINITY_DN1216_c0_g2_i8:101-949(-)
MGELTNLLGKHKCLGFIGGGNMCEALIKGLFSSHLLAPNQVIVSDPVESRLDYFRHLGCSATSNNDEVVDKSAVIILAIKPQVAEAVLTKLMPVHESKLFISIMAGKTTDWIISKLSQLSGVRLVRVMPNTPLMVCEGATGLLKDKNSHPSDLTVCKELFLLVGEVEVVEDEELINSVTAVSGSGPAYVFHLIEGMIEGGKAVGLTEDQARRLAIQTVVGAGKLAKEQQEKGVSPAKLRETVTSPGGTTAAALKVMADNNFKGIVSSSIVAAAQRGRELGKL